MSVDAIFPTSCWPRCSFLSLLTVLPMPELVSEPMLIGICWSSLNSCTQRASARRAWEASGLALASAACCSQLLRTLSAAECEKSVSSSVVLVARRAHMTSSSAEGELHLPELTRLTRVCI